MRLKAFLNNFAIVKSALFASILTAVVISVESKSPVFDSFEYWTSDWRTALFARSLKAQHPKIAVILINDATLANFKYRSPIDRQFLSDLVLAIDQAEPAVLGVDLIIDQPTEPEKDQRLLSVLQNVKTKIVLVSVDADTRAEGFQREFNKNFLTNAGKQISSPAIQIEVDGTVRRRSVSKSDTPLFAEAIANTTGSLMAPRSRLIAWLSNPVNEDAFLVVYAHDLLPQYSALPENRRAQLISNLKGRAIILGASLEDRRVSFQTPLTKLSNDAMPGAMIHAHITAQLIDGRSYITFPQNLTYAMTFLAALVSFSLGWRYTDSSYKISILPLAAFIVVDVFCFTQFNLVVPFTLPALAWFVGVFGGQWLYNFRRGKTRVTAD